MACEDLAREALEPFARLIEAADAAAVKYLRDEPDNEAMSDAELASLFHPDHAVCLTDGKMSKPVGLTWGDLRRARTAYDAIGSGVKALKWSEITAARSDEDPSHEPTGDYEAATGIGIYYIDCVLDKFSVSLNGDDISSHDEPDEAKAAAQADFERRVLSCLSTHTAAGAGPVGEAVAWADREQLAALANDPEAGGLMYGRQVNDEVPLYASPVDEPGEVEDASDEVRILLAVVEAIAVDPISLVSMSDSAVRGWAIAAANVATDALDSLSAINPSERESREDRIREDERERIAKELETEADTTPCQEDANVTRGLAWLVRADFSYEDAEILEAASDRARLRGDAS